MPPRDTLSRAYALDAAYRLRPNFPSQAMQERARWAASDFGRGTSMSKVKELADAEAKRAEADQPDEPDEPTGDEPTGDEPSDDATALATGEPSKKQLRALDDERQRHSDAVREIMGAFVAGFITCRTCDGLGLDAPEPEVKTNAKFRECPTCNGYGQVLTGSRASGNVTQPCPGCAGRGYQERLREVQAQTAEHVEGNGAQAEFGTPAYLGDPTIRPEPVFGPPA